MSSKRTTFRSSNIILKRQNAMDEEEFEDILTSQQDIDSEVVGSIICCVNRDKVQMKIPVINQIMTWFGVVIGILFFIRGLIDGRLSMIGLWLRLFYFSILSISYGLDDRLTVDRLSFLIPSLSGLLLTLAQLIGLFISDGPFTCDSFETCL
jgi:hypothetical protein